MTEVLAEKLDIDHLRQWIGRSTEASDLVTVRSALQEAGIDYESADVEFVPNLKVEVDADTARKVFRLIDALEDSDDVQNVYSNFDLTADVQAELEAED